MLDGLREAILHLVRNAVDHGIEPPAAREQAGKPRTGTVAVAAAVRGDRIIVTVADDGAGLDVPAIRAQLERRGGPVPTEERDLAPALFAAGVSTRTEATVISGRGVGLDVVRAAVGRIRGNVDVTWVAGRGTTFTLECPPTLATIRALLVAVGPQMLAVPTIHVARLTRVTPQGIKRAEGREVIATPEGPVPLVALARLLPPLVERPVAGAVPVVTLTAGERRLAVAVDELLAEQEIVLRPMALGQKPLPYLSGATLLGTGRVALVLDPAAIVAAGRGLSAGPGLALAPPKPAGPAKRRVLVVDDSITTRTLEQRTPEHRARGLEVGADAYLGKSSFDQQNLLDTIGQLLG